MLPTAFQGNQKQPLIRMNLDLPLFYWKEEGEEIPKESIVEDAAMNSIFRFCFLINTSIPYTLPKTTSSPLEIGLPKRKAVSQPSIFRGYVSFREGGCSTPGCFIVRPGHGEDWPKRGRMEVLFIVVTSLKVVFDIGCEIVDLFPFVSAQKCWFVVRLLCITGLLYWVVYLFLPLLEEMIHFDQYFQMGWNHQLLGCPRKLVKG